MIGYFRLESYGTTITTGTTTYVAMSESLELAAAETGKRVGAVHWLRENR